MARIFLLACMLAFGLPAQAVGIGELFGALMGQSGMTKGKANVDQALVGLAAQFNKKTPAMVDQHTRLDKVSAEPGAHLTYHYTLIGMRNAELERADFQAKMRQQLKSRLCSSAEMQNFLKSGVNISYRYKTSDGGPIADFSFSPSDCGYAVGRATEHAGEYAAKYSAK